MLAAGPCDTHTPMSHPHYFPLQCQQVSSFSSAWSPHAPGAPSRALPEPFQDGWEDGGIQGDAAGKCQRFPLWSLCVS